MTGYATCYSKFCCSLPSGYIYMPGTKLCCYGGGMGGYMGIYMGCYIGICMGGYIGICMLSCMGT